MATAAHQPQPHATSSSSSHSSPFHTPSPSSSSFDLHRESRNYQNHPALLRLRERDHGPLERNASTSSSRSTTTTSSTTSSLVAVPIRPPPIETRTAATGAEQLGAVPPGGGGYGYGFDGSHGQGRASSAAGTYARYGPNGQGQGFGYEGRSQQGEGSGNGSTPSPGHGFAGPSSPNASMGYYSPQPEAIYGGRGFQRNGPRSAGGGGGSGAGPYSIPTSVSAPGHSRNPGAATEQTQSRYRSKQATLPPALSLPAIVTDDTPTRSSSVPVPGGYDPRGAAMGMSPTTPRARRFGGGEPEVLGYGEGGGSPQSNGLARPRQFPASPGSGSGSGIGGGGGGGLDMRVRAMSASGSGRERLGERDGMSERERRMSVASARSAASGSGGAGGAGAQRVRETTADYVFGEELGRGSYSTVVQATRSSTSTTATSPTTSSSQPGQPARQYAIKIINQAHLIQERKTKYAMIERDALVRLNLPRPQGVAGSGKGHRRGTSGSSGTPSGMVVAGTISAAGGGPRKNRSTASLSGLSTATAFPSGSGSGSGGANGRRDSIAAGGDRLSVFSDSSSSTTTINPSTSVSAIPLSSPTLSTGSSSTASMFFAPSSTKTSASGAGRRPSRSADPPEMVPERSEEGHEGEMSLDSPRFESSGGGGVFINSRPPSPVKEDVKREEIEDKEEQEEDMKTPPSRSTGKVSDALRYETPEYGQGQGFVGSVGAERRVQRLSNEDNERNGPAPTGTRSRRASKAPSEKSNKSGKGRIPGTHPGIIRLYSTFNDATSLCESSTYESGAKTTNLSERDGNGQAKGETLMMVDFVLELAGKGELLTYLRKFGSLNIESARYYAALILDTIEFMHERGVVHRDLKPENILLDEDMRIKVTDFGSAKLLNKEGKDPKDGEEEGTKRSFVGSADFVSPEVLRNEPAVAASDIWAFGSIVYQLIVGKPPFRGATDYLTFQKILKRDMEFPEGFDEEAKTMIEVILNLDAAARPNASDLKVHPFFSSIDWPTLWQTPAPAMSTGLTKPVVTLANVDPASDIWAVFEDEYSDGGFDLDDNEGEETSFSKPPTSRLPSSNINPNSGGLGVQRQLSNRLSPQYDARAAAQAVWSVDSPHSGADSRPNPFDNIHGPGNREGEDYANALEPPKPAYMDNPHTPRKLRGFSRGSVRSSSSSSGNRTALTGLLETMGIVQSMNGTGSGRTSRTSMKSESTGSGFMSPVKNAAVSAGRRMSMPKSQLEVKETRADLKRWNQLLLTNESIIFTSPITIRTSSLPSFLSPNSTKRRQLILTDFPRIFTVKEESPSSAIQSASSLSAASQASLSVKNECVFVVRPSAGSGTGGALAVGGGAGGGGANRVLDVMEKGPKGFTVQTSSQTFSYMADTAEIRNEWMSAIHRVSA